MSLAASLALRIWWRYTEPQTALFLAQQDASGVTGEAVDALKWNEEHGFGGYDAWVSPDQPR